MAYRIDQSIIDENMALLEAIKRKAAMGESFTCYPSPQQSLNNLRWNISEVLKNAEVLQAPGFSNLRRLLRVTTDVDDEGRACVRVVPKKKAIAVDLDDGPPMMDTIPYKRQLDDFMDSPLAEDTIAWGGADFGGLEGARAYAENILKLEVLDESEDGDTLSMQVRKPGSDDGTSIWDTI